MTPPALRRGTSPHTLLALCTRRGRRWLVMNDASSVFGVVCEMERCWELRVLVRRPTLDVLLDGGLVELGDAAAVSPYEGGRGVWRWDEGRLGRRISVTQCGRDVYLAS